MKGYETLTALVRGHDIDTAFGLIGDTNAHFMSHLVHVGIRVVQARDEHTAVAMADGYARVRDGLGFALVTSGPGLTQAVTSLAVANLRGTPLVLFAGDHPANTNRRSTVQRRALVDAVGAGFEQVRTTAELPVVVNRAFTRALDERRPVVLSVGSDIQQQNCPPATARTTRRPTATRVLDYAELRRAEATLLAADRPVVLAGRGALGAREQVMRLGARIGALLSTTLAVRDWFSGEPYDVGVAGGLADEPARQLLRDADCVVAVGTSLDPRSTISGTLFADATLIHIDIDPKNDPATIPVRGDAGDVLDALLERLSPAPNRPLGYRARVAAQLPRTERLPGTIPRGLADPVRLVQTLDALVPADALLVNGIGHYWWFPLTELSGRGPGSYLMPYEYGVMGQSLPTAIGASLGTDRPVVVFEGDGGLLTNLQELETIDRERIDLFVVVMNDGAYGAEVDMLRHHGLDGGLARYGYTDVAAVGRALGLTTFVVTDATELADAYRAKTPGTTVLVDARIPTAHLPEHLEAVVRSR